MRSFPKQILRTLTAFAGLAVLSVAASMAQDAGASDGQSQPAAQQGQRTDAQIEMDVVHSLDASDPLKNDLITAATIQTEVTLSGTVASDANKKLAESIAARVNGVTEVHNNLKVGDPAADAQNLQPAPDDDMPDADQSQAQQSMANLPPPGPSPDQSANPNMSQGNQPQNESQAAPSGYPAPPQQGGYPAPPQQGYPGYPQQGGYPAPPPQRPEYQGQYPPQYPNQYPPEYQRGPRYEPARGPVTLEPGTLLQLRTSEPVDSKHAKDGQPVEFMVIQDVTAGGFLAIPRGAVVHGVVTEAKNVGSGQMAGNSIIALTLTSLDLGGRNYPLQTSEFKVKAPNKAGQTVGSAVTGGIFGTIIGCAIGRGAGCAIGAGAGVIAGTAAGTASSGPRAWIPAEALVTFHLAAPLTVDPVSPQEAARLAQGLYPGGPRLYQRPPYGYAPYPAYYPAPYYRPYYVVGGAYYWR